MTICQDELGIQDIGRGSVYDNTVCTSYLAQELYVAQKLFFSNSVIFILKKIT